jgi:protein-disulfide isomerase
VYFAHNPLGFHPNAMPSAKASMAAHRQGKFWEYHDKLFENQRQLSDENYVKWAQELGLDVEKFKRDMADPALQAEIERQQKAVVALGARGTPGFFINGELLSGAQPFPAFKTVIDKQLAAANAKGGDWVAVAKESNPQGDNFVNWIVKGQAPSAQAAEAPKRDAAPQKRPPADPTVWKVTVEDNDPIKGKKDAIVKMVVFSEFQ